MKTTVSTCCQNRTQAHSCPARSCGMQLSSLSRCSSHFFPFYSFCSSSPASFLFLRCVGLLSVSGLLHLLFLGFSFPRFLHDSLIVSFRSQICFPFSEWPSLNGGLLHLLSITPLFTSFIAHTAGCNDFIWLFTHHEPASPSRPKSGILSVSTHVSPGLSAVLDNRRHLIFWWMKEWRNTKCHPSALHHHCIFTTFTIDTRGNWSPESVTKRRDLISVYLSAKVCARISYEVVVRS